MSTLNHDKKALATNPPPWTLDIPEADYHAASASGLFLSSGMLREFRQCPAQYHALVAGRAGKGDSDAFRFGRAVHTLILEGEGAFRSAFAVGGPMNERTGRAFRPGTRAFDDWLRDRGADSRAVITPDEADAMFRMAEAARAHPEIARVFAGGWAERTVRARVRGIECQARLDWLGPEGTLADLKTVEDISRFEADARRFGYLHQFAFYRDAAAAGGGGDLAALAVVLEKKPPHRAGVWRFSADVLEPYADQNRQAIDSLLRCRQDNRWPTGYESPRNFPLAGIPPLWLN